MRPPQGCMTVFDADSKFRPDLFFTDLWAATSLTRVDSLDEKMLEDCQERVRANIPVASLQPAKFEGSDDTLWTPSLGDRDTFIGLYSCNRLDPKTSMVKQEFFVIANTSMDAKTQEELETYLMSCEAKGMTYREVFERNPVLEQYKALVARNRRRIIHEFAKSIGATVRGRQYSKGASPMAISNIEIETVTTYPKLVGDELILYSNCTSAEDIQHGLIFTRAPLQAPLVFVGPTARQSTALFSGQKWRNDHHSVFMTSFGKHVHASTFNQFSKIGISLSALNDKLILDVKAEANTELLRYFPYTERNSKQREVERALGYKEQNVVP